MDVDVYQTNHHGAEDASSLPFLQDLSPNVIVISNGSHGGFHHPRETTLERMQSLSPAATIFQLNKYLDGDQRGANVPDDFISDLEAGDADGTITLTVDTTACTCALAYRDHAHSFDIKDRESGGLVIEALLPNPTDEPDRIGETVTLRNDGPGSVSLDGWLLRDAGGRVWTLAELGTVSAGSTATIQRNAMPMSLNNRTPETIELIDESGAVVDSFSYEGWEPGVEIETGH